MTSPYKLTTSASTLLKDICGAAVLRMVLISGRLCRVSSQLPAATDSADMEEEDTPGGVLGVCVLV